MSYYLKPFDENLEVQDVQIQADVVREGQSLLIHFQLIDPQNKILLAPVKPSHQRQKGLWKTTCLEAFWKDNDDSVRAYWELNLASTLDWNIFAFDDVRTPFEREDLKFKKCLAHRTDTGFSVQVDLKKIDLENKKIKLSLTAVLEHKTGFKSYWALAHKDVKPDFHNMKSFIVTL